MRENFLGSIEKDLRDLAIGFGFPRNLAYNAYDTQDLRPAKWVEMKDGAGYECICRTVGINPEDVKIELKEDCIYVSGETAYEEIKYNTRYELPLARDIMSNIKNIKFRSLNGLTYIYVYVDRKDKNRIVAERI